MQSKRKTDRALDVLEVELFQPTFMLKVCNSKISKIKKCHSQK